MRYLPVCTIVFSAGVESTIAEPRRDSTRQIPNHGETPGAKFARLVQVAFNCRPKLMSLGFSGARQRMEATLMKLAVDF